MGMTQEPPFSGEQDVIGNDMSDDDQRILHLWRDSLILLDPRYHDKQLLQFAARAMVDDELRAKFAARDARDAKEAPESGGYESGLAEVRFYVNTPDTLHVVLPPRAGETEQRPRELRDALRSRTSADAESLFRDDFNISDPGGADPPIVVFPGSDGGADGPFGDAPVPPT
jgi:hypothetical protein